mgnify:CR=1 FL=1
MTWHTVDPASNADANPINIGGLDLLVACIDGEWYAVEDRCSHADCTFSSDGELDGSTLICNCHGSEFDFRTGAPLVMPAAKALHTFAIREIDGLLEIGL